MTETLKLYLGNDDPNKFWRLSTGAHENLLDEAIDEIERLQRILWKIGMMAENATTNSIL